jgi:mannosyl-oligosaccharide glucosidase
MICFLLSLIGWTSAQLATDDKALRWGPYRPQKYFGIRPQAPTTLLFSLMWADGNDQETMLQSTPPS